MKHYTSRKTPPMLFDMCLNEAQFTDAATAFAAVVSEHHERESIEASIPIMLGGRPDLVASMNIASSLYDGVHRPNRVPYGVVLGDIAKSGGPLLTLASPFAERWIAFDEAMHCDDELLVVALYQDLSSEWMRPLILKSRTRALSVLSGRDLSSLSWVIAKQYLRVSRELTDVGIITDVDRPSSREGLTVFDDRDFEVLDVSAEVLSRRWRSILFQGHGKDDNLNLGSYTVCGLSQVAPRLPGRLGPRCAYGNGCFKDESKLIPLNEVRATEIVLSACNSGPLSDLALYDPKFQLLLSALDGPGQTVTSAVSVHDSDRPENVAWIDAVAGDKDASSALNSSLYSTIPYGAFLRFGLLRSQLSSPTVQGGGNKESLEILAQNRAQALLGGYLLSPKHWLRPRLDKLSRKLDVAVSRTSAVTGAETREARRQLESDLQSIDLAIRNRIVAAPEDELMNYPSYFGDRSQMDESSVVSVPCACGRLAQRFSRQSQIANVLDTNALVCFRCGDVCFEMNKGPQVSAAAQDLIASGGTLSVEIEVTAGRSGPVQIGLFLPVYMRQGNRPEVAWSKVKAKQGVPATVQASIEVSPETAPQAYYFTAFAVQDLGISTVRRHFGVVPV